MNLIPFQAVYPDLKLISSPESFFGTVKSQYPKYEESGFFKKSSQEALYLYQISTTHGDFIGVVACTDVEDFQTNKVLKHEHTLAQKEQRMMHVILENKAMVKPILLAYDSTAEIEKYLNEFIQQNVPFLDIEFTELKEKHTMYRISDGADIEVFRSLFQSQVSVSYIADGHHRCSTFHSLYKNNHPSVHEDSFRGILSIYISFDQLKIYDYNRVMDILRDVSPVDFVIRLSKYCSIKKLKKGRKPKRKFEMVLYLEKNWYRLRWKSKILEQYKDMIILDTELLNKYIVKAICGIKDVREDARIRYVDGVSGIEGLEAEVNKNPYRVGLCLYPVDKNELKKIAEAGETLPPKSTWFEPRIKNDMIVKEL